MKIETTWTNIYMAQFGGPFSVKDRDKFFALFNVVCYRLNNAKMTFI